MQTKFIVGDIKFSPISSHPYVDYLKEEVSRHVSLCMKGEKMERSNALSNELSAYRKHIALMLNALKKLGVSEEERQSLLNPMAKEA